MTSKSPIRSANTDGRKFLPGAREKLLALLSTSSSAAASPPDLWSRVLGVVLESAYKQHDWDLATALVRAGARVGALDLHAAIRGGQDELAVALLDHGAAASTRDPVGQSPLHLAALQGNGAIAELLLRKGADIDAEVGGSTPLSLAAEGGSVEVVQVLIGAGADAGVRHGLSPLITAVEYGHVHVLKAMIELGGDVNAAGAAGWTALHSTTEKTMILVLVEAGADIEARDSEGDTALNYLAQYHAIGPMRALVGHGADVNTQNEKGDAPLHFAARAAGDQGAAQLVEFLLRSGADETLVNENNETAADVVGQREHKHDTEKNMEGVRKLLANAPADRAWRRRGLLLLCTARCRRSQQRGNETVSNTPGIDAQESNNGEPAGSVSVVEERDDGKRGRLAPRLVELVLGKEGIFRTIVGFV